MTDSLTTSDAVTDGSTTSSPTCRRCGHRVTWAKYPEATGWNSWHPPLGYAGAAYVVLGGEVHKVPTYQKHECHPDDVSRYQADLAQVREERRLARRASPEYLEQREIDAQLLTIFNEESMRFTCPRCEVAADRMCINLSKSRSGQQVATKKAHIERWRVAQASNPTIGDTSGPPDPRIDERSNGISREEER